MSGRADAGISQSTSLIGTSSDIEHHARAPAHRIVPAQLEPVERHALDEMRALAAVTLDARAETAVAKLELRDALRHEPLDLAEVHELAQPFDQEERRLVVGLELELVRRRRPRTIVGELRERLDRRFEYSRLRWRLDLELELGGVLETSLSSPSDW
jgi:hypothetical protein